MNRQGPHLQFNVRYSQDCAHHRVAAVLQPDIHPSKQYYRCSQGGIGNALARDFHSRGLRVLATARTAEAIEDLADAGIETLQLDVTSVKSVAICKDEVSKRTGGQLNYLVNNAGKSTRASRLEGQFHVYTD